MPRAVAPLSSEYAAAPSRAVRQTTVQPQPTCPGKLSGPILQEALQRSGALALHHLQLRGADLRRANLAILLERRDPVLERRLRVRDIRNNLGDGHATLRDRHLPVALHESKDFRQPG